MRPVLTLLFVVGLMAGMGAYIRFADSVKRPAQTFSIDYATGKFEVIIDRSFECEPDLIVEIKSLEVKLKDETVFTSDTNIPVNEAVRFSIQQGVEQGENELYVVANRPSEADGLAAIKVTVLCDDIVVAEQTISADAGVQAVYGTVLFQIQPTTQIDEHDHS